MMNQYEIMMILAPAENENVAKDLLASVFKSGKVTKFEVMDRTELAYEINKSKVAKYILATVEADPSADEVSEFVRRANIAKTIWRHLVINLSRENGFGKAATPRPVRERRTPGVNDGEQRRFVRKPNNARPRFTKKDEA